jgi:PAS domain S-box-containing protein
MVSGMVTLDTDTLPVAPRQRIRWLQRLAVAGVVGAVGLLLALVWAMLPARLDPVRVASPTAARANGDACARRLIEVWSGSDPALRYTSDEHRRLLLEAAQGCSHGQSGLVESHLLQLDEGRLELQLHGVTEDLATPDYLAQARSARQRGQVIELGAPSGDFTDRLHPVPVPAGRAPLVLVQRYARAEGLSSARGVSDGVPAAVRQVQWLLSALALGLVALVVASLRWLGRSQRDYQHTLRQEIAAREAVALKLEEEATLRRDIEESISVGLRVVDREGRLVYVNRAFCETSGWTEQALMARSATGQPQYPFWPDDQVPQLAAHLQEILSGQARPDSYRVPFIRPDGTRWTAQVSARALGSGKGWILASTDVTREVEDQRRIESLNEQLRQDSSIQLIGERSGELLHKLSNHTGACLAALDGVTRHLQAGRHDLLGEGVRIAGRAAKHLHDIVERYRPVLRDEAAKEPSLLRDTVADAMAQVSAYAAQHNVVMHNTVSAELPPITMDRLILCEVLSNLLHNAISVMESTPITNRLISVENYLDEDAGQVQIHVRDRGPGVEPAQREAVFERRYSTRQGGHGWGLPLCRRWVERLGGRLVVTDNQPRGADFVITLPLTCTEETPAHDAPDRPAA